MGLRKIEQNCLSLGVVLAEFADVSADWPAFQSLTVQRLSECVPVVCPEKGLTKGLCWLQPTVLSAGLLCMTPICQVVFPLLEA